MKREAFMKQLIPQDVNVNPIGRSADELSPEEFKAIADTFFDHIMKIGKADISQITGYGEFNTDNELSFETCKDFILGTFVEQEEGYWYHWKSMFDTSMLTKELYETYLEKTLHYVTYCENQRFLVNNNTFFANMITDQKAQVGFPDWSRAGITDFLLDFVIMDLNKPYLNIPTLLRQYFEANQIQVPNFRERYLCMAYYKGLDVFRWHASIDDEESCQSIITYLEELEKRV